MSSAIVPRRYTSISRLYGEKGLRALRTGHVCVVGLGGVGSWAAEALARSGVGHLRLIDMDHVAESNLNRQVQALMTTLGQAKTEALRDRLQAANPECCIHVVDDFLAPENATQYLYQADVVIDATDDIRAKVAMVLFCKSHGIPLVVSGGAGGKTDPAAIRMLDLARTTHDQLLAKLRYTLRREHGFSRDPKRQFGIPAIYSQQGAVRPEAVCDTVLEASGLSCAGYGSLVTVTACFGLFAAQKAMDILLSEGD